MGLVKICDNLHANVRLASAAFSRSINAQAEHWMRVGMLAELNPALNYSEICQMLLRGEGDPQQSAAGGVLDEAAAEKVAS